MKFIIKNKDKVYIILPIIFAILAILIHFSRGKFYYSYVDPEYFHLFNGLNLAIFNLAIDFIHHPGTTIQMMFALSAPIVNLLQPGSGIISNALENPEDFIHGANILMNIITALVVFALGLRVYRSTNNIYYALLLQLIPFSNYSLLIISGRLIPEAALIAPILLLILLLVKYLYDPNAVKNEKKYLISFAIVGGLGMAGKYLYLPFLIIPFFLFNDKRLWLKYALYTFVAFVVFAFPVFVHFGKSWEWLSGIFLHSGKYGAGNSFIIDFDTAPNHLTALFEKDKSFFVILLLGFVQWFVSIFIPKKRDSALFSGFHKILLGTILAVTISILMITKHFALHYYYPTLMFKGFIMYLMTELLVRSLKRYKFVNYIPLLTLLIMMVFCYNQISPLSYSNNLLKARAQNMDERIVILKNYDTIDTPLIITSHYQGSPFIESSLVAGFLMSGSLKSTFIDNLTESYPNTYFYYDWSDQFYLWDQFKDAKEFIEPNKPVYIFIGEGKEENLEAILNRLENDFPNYNLQLKSLHNFTEPDEYFYEVEFTSLISEGVIFFHHDKQQEIIFQK